MAGSPKGVVPQPGHTGCLLPQVTPPIADIPVCFQNDRVKALKAMEMTWNNMEKKEKLMWIKKAAEDQKRYEVGRRALPQSAWWARWSWGRLPLPPLQGSQPPFLSGWVVEPEAPAWAV